MPTYSRYRFVAVTRMRTYVHGRPEAAQRECLNRPRLAAPRVCHLERASEAELSSRDENEAREGHAWRL